MTSEEETAIRERAKIVGNKVWDVPDGDINGRILNIGPIEGYDGDALGFRHGDPTVDFIAHSPADTHALLTEIDRLRTVNERIGFGETGWPRVLQFQDENAQLETKNQKLRDMLQRTIDAYDYSMESEYNSPSDMSDEVRALLDSTEK